MNALSLHSGVLILLNLLCLPAHYRDIWYEQLSLTRHQKFEAISPRGPHTLRKGYFPMPPQDCRPAFKKLQLLTLPCLYILEAVLFCKSKCALTRGRDVHEYETRGRDNYRTGRHRTVVYEHLPSQAGVRFINSLPDFMKNVQTPKALKTRLKRFLASKAFYSVDEFLNYSWETSNLED
ncbi:hypothetical protein J6590_056032 [Homalodisca vitripennis]|nr:hypothetical protein J6590_056032 [Homalodisca vitripennis]